MVYIKRFESINSLFGNSTIVQITKDNYEEYISFFENRAILKDGVNQEVEHISDIIRKYNVGPLEIYVDTTESGFKTIIHGVVDYMDNYIKYSFNIGLRRKYTIYISFYTDEYYVISSVLYSGAFYLGSLKYIIDGRENVGSCINTILDKQHSEFHSEKISTEVFIESQSYDNPRKIDNSEYKDYNDKERDKFDDRDIEIVTKASKSKSFRGGSSIVVSLDNNGEIFRIVVKKTRKKGFGRTKEIVYRHYHFNIKKLKDEYFLVNSSVDYVKYTVIGHQKSKDSDYKSGDSWILDQHTELKKLIDRIIYFSKSSSTNFSFDS